jgi:hypothetical protein
MSSRTSAYAFVWLHGHGALPILTVAMYSDSIGRWLGVAEPCYLVAQFGDLAVEFGDLYALNEHNAMVRGG